mmetsp:Transcript_34/g.86  ORF Transcript_34/g.86 Transcript_34/m.86 type:complete len:268 (-) Transcript_34:493-1296(-)
MSQPAGTVILVESESAEPPGHFFTTHSTALVDSVYVAVCTPREAFAGSETDAADADLGTLKVMRTLTAWSLSGKSAFTVTCSSVLNSDRWCTVGHSRKGSWRSERRVPIRKFITTNSPDGGASVRTFSDSKRSSTTHSWKLTSSSCTAPYTPPAARPPAPPDAITRSSLSARCTCGEPLRNDFIWMHPSTEKVRTWPSAVSRAEIRSTRSMKISFPPPDRHPLIPPCACSTTDLCAAADAIVFGLALNDGNMVVTLGGSTGTGLLKR